MPFALIVQLLKYALSYDPHYTTPAVTPVISISVFVTRAVAALAWAKLGKGGADCRDTSDLALFGQLSTRKKSKNLLKISGLRA
jgi:hypothetical protein